MTSEPQGVSFSLADLPSVGPASLTMGVFDGVHLGHRRLLAATRDAATTHGAGSVALIFDPPPVEVLSPGTLLPRLSSPPLTRKLVAAAGMDHALPVRFDAGLRQLAAAEFLQALAPAIELRALVMTPESAFGRDRGGTAAAMKELGSRRGFEVIVVEPLVVDGKPVSSSRVREAVAAGDLATASRLLGRPPSVGGTVVEGDRRGRELGFPTANLAFAYHPAMPPLGIYAGRAAIPQRGVPEGHPALVSIGVRPTFHHDGRLLVEVYLLDFDGDLYGATLTVELVARLREERRFEDSAALVAQMRRDESDARWLLGIGG